MAPLGITYHSLKAFNKFHQYDIVHWNDDGSSVVGWFPFVLGNCEENGNQGQWR